MTTANTIISAALRQLKVIPPGAGAGTETLATGLEQLNMMLGSWGADRLTVPFVTWDTFTLTVGDGEYTIGATGDVVKTRPEAIDRAFIRDDGSLDHFLRIIDEATYMKIRIKAMAGRPSVLWYNPTVPNGTLQLYPIPNSEENFYYSHVSNFAEPATGGATTIVPRNYDGPLMWNLAMWLAPIFGVTPSPVVAMMADKGKRDIIGLNAVRRQKSAVLDITKVSPLYDLGEGGGDVVEGLILE